MTGLAKRRAKQYERLVTLLGGYRPALEVLNETGRIGIDGQDEQSDVVDAIIGSIERGQRWATGASSVEIHPCPVCAGTGKSRSSHRKRCGACNGNGRRQTACRACAEGGFLTCVQCKGYRQLDPVNDRETILRQHREWWEKVTEMSEPKTEEQSTHAGPPERPSALRGVLERPEDGLSLVWDAELGDDDTGIGTKEKPYRTYAQAEHVADMSIGIRPTSVFDPAELALPPTSPMPRVIAIALLRAQRRIKRVPKSSRNEGDDYSYTSAETIVEEARGALLDEGLCVTLHDWDSDGVEIMVRWMYIHESGEQYIMPALPMPIVLDGGLDKRAPDKALATALTYLESQVLRVALQIPRIGRSEDADARSDGNTSRRPRSRAPRDEGTAPLSTELNDTVLALHDAIEGAKTAKNLDGARRRFEAVKERLPPAVVARVNERLEKKTAEITPPAVEAT